MRSAACGLLFSCSALHLLERAQLLHAPQEGHQLRALVVHRVGALSQAVAAHFIGSAMGEYQQLLLRRPLLAAIEDGQAIAMLKTRPEPSTLRPRIQEGKSALALV